jgi:hypothetical protein
MFQLYRGRQFYWWRKPEYSNRRKPTCRKSLTNLFIKIYAINEDIKPIQKCKIWTILCILRGRRDNDRVVVGFTTTYAINAYHHWSCEFESCSWWGVIDTCDEGVSDLRQAGGILRVIRFPTAIKQTATI